jgi:hypothetical protein
LKYETTCSDGTTGSEGTAFKCCSMGGDCTSRRLGASVPAATLHTDTEVESNPIRACYALLCDRIPEGRRPGDPLAQPEGLGKRHHNGAPRRGAIYLLVPKLLLGNAPVFEAPASPACSHEMAKRVQIALRPEAGASQTSSFPSKNLGTSEYRPLPNLPSAMLCPIDSGEDGTQTSIR